MPQVKLKIKPSGEQFDRFTADHPNTEYRAVASRLTEDGLLVLMDIETPDPAAIVHEFETAPIMQSYTVLHTGDQSLLLQFSMHEPPPHRAFSAAGVVVVPPLLIRNGWLLFEVIAPHEQLSRVEDALDTTGMNYEITSVMSLTDPSELLTDRQQHVVTEAITRGYYDTPRECSLTNLATGLEISTSTASDTLHRAEGHIIKEFMEAADMDTE